MFNFFKKTTTDLVKEWNTIYTNEVINNSSLTDQDRKDIPNYVFKYKDELTVVLNSLTEGIRLKNGDKISKVFFYETLEWLHKIIWASIILGVKSNKNFRKSFDDFMVFYRNPEETIEKYEELKKKYNLEEL